MNVVSCCFKITLLHYESETPSWISNCRPLHFTCRCLSWICCFFGKQRAKCVVKTYPSISSVSKCEYGYVAVSVLILLWHARGTSMCSYPNALCVCESSLLYLTHCLIHRCTPARGSGYSHCVSWLAPKLDPQNHRQWRYWLETTMSVYSVCEWAKGTAITDGEDTSRPDIHRMHNYLSVEIFFYRINFVNFSALQYLVCLQVKVEDVWSVETWASHSGRRLTL